MLTRRQLIALAGAAFLPPSPSCRSFWVFKLLRPESLHIQPLGTARLHCSSSAGRYIIEGTQSLSLTPLSAPVHIAGPANQPVPCLLEIPGLIRRPYFGTFDILSQQGVLLPIVTIDCECATGSIVSAELPTAACLPAALAAQAATPAPISATPPIASSSALPPPQAVQSHKPSTPPAP